MTPIVGLNPPRCGAVFQVGVTGHRDLTAADSPRLSSVINELLAVIADAAPIEMAREQTEVLAERPPVLRCVSSLADGADTLIAKSALRLGYRLQCPLPFPRDDYLAELPDTARAECSACLAEAEAVLELDGTVDRAPDAYLAAGRVILDQSDLLLAVWDGQPPRGVGGTGQIVAEARDRRIPVVLVDSRSPHAVHVLQPAASGRPLSEPDPDWQRCVPVIVRSTLIPPDGAGMRSQRTELIRYLLETRRPIRWYMRLHVLFQRMLLFTRVAASPVVADTPDDESLGAVDRHKDWANDLAVFYGSLHRSFVVLRYLLVPFVILGACIGSFAQPPQVRQAGFFVQALALILILVVSWVSRRHKWLQRFTDDRLLAEELRHQRYLGVLGHTLPGLILSPYRRSDTVTWVDWLLRAAVRETGLPNDRMIPARMAEIAAMIRRELDQQRAYHERVATVYSASARRLERIGTLLYQSGLAVIIIRALVVYSQAGNQPPQWLTILALALPVLAPVFLGLRAQAEYARLGEQSRAIAAELDGLVSAIGSAPPRSHRQLADLARAAAQIMMGETADWRLALKARPILPT